ncbi:MAG TPA: hypothetical protein VFA18_04870, partial [Gemmataceae bacterium]|nr:hypothetical protein [Gemmataceae bacterium]
MQRTRTCSQGHQWQTPTESATWADPADEACPICYPPDRLPPPPSERSGAVRVVRAVLSAAPAPGGPSALTVEQTPYDAVPGQT